jgi:hypothetical protein
MRDSGRSRRACRPTRVPASRMPELQPPLIEILVSKSSEETRRNLSAGRRWWRAHEGLRKRLNTRHFSRRWHAWCVVLITLPGVVVRRPQRDVSSRSRTSPQVGGRRVPRSDRHAHAACMRTSNTGAKATTVHAAPDTHDRPVEGASGRVALPPPKKRHRLRCAGGPAHEPRKAARKRTAADTAPKPQAGRHGPKAHPAGAAAGKAARTRARCRPAAGCPGAVKTRRAPFDAHARQAAARFRPLPSVC